MIVIDYKKKFHKQIINSCVLALKQGKTVAYPTDTSYGLAADSASIKGIKKLYQIKERGFNKPVHVVVPSIAYAKKIAHWNKAAEKLAKKFWPGALTIILPGSSRSTSKTLAMLSANTGTVGLRLPKNKIAMDLAKYLGRPITATSANPPNHIGGDDSYSADDIVRQFEHKKYKPDIIINAGKLPMTKPSTMVRLFDDVVKILRVGPVSEKQIMSLLNTK